MDDLIKEFLVECHENLDRFDQDLVVMENDPSSRDTLAAIFRTIHTIKGTSGFLGFSKLESTTHAGENLLSDLREGKLIINQQITTALLALGDAVRRILSSIESSEQEGNEEFSELVATLTRLREGKPAVEAAPAPAPQPVAPPVVSAPPQPAPAPPVQPATPVVQPPVVQQIVEQSEHIEHNENRAQQPQHVSDSTIRVDVALLDRLMNLAGELVLARNQILQTSSNDQTFTAASQHLNLITTELQAGVMKARMQPIKNIWSKFPRVVRDLSQTCGKQVRLEMEGEDTELDRTIIESIKDPLTHLLRNAVDHGIETPAERIARGKSPEGRLLLHAFHESGHVIIDICDDGAGLDLDRIREKGLQRGVITAENVSRMSDRELMALIFAPGFSTAQKVSNVSGRGVGMDVVKTNIEKIGGSVEIESKQGAGTTCKIKIPLTLAIIPALIVKSGADRYAIPQVSLIELVRLEGSESVERIQGVPVYRLRGELLPLVYLNRELRITLEEDKALDVVVLQAGQQRFGLVVDEVCDTEEIVVKPLGKQLKGISCFAGATIMGDGTVALILDVFNFAQRSGVVGASKENTTQEVAELDSEAGEWQTLLLFEAREGEHMAIPLSTVARLEEFSSTSIERSASRDVVQYRGEILPLIKIDAVLQGGSGDLDDDGPLQAIVYNENGRSVGLVVKRIRDIVRERVNVRQSTKREWTLGSTVIRQHVTDLLDVREIIRAVEPAFFQETQP